MHLIEAMIAARMLIETNSVVVHVRRDLLLPCPLCQSRFFFIFGFGFPIQLVFILDFVLGFFGDLEV